MSEQADLDELARRYLDLWQDQMSALAGDKAFTESLQRLMAAMGLPAAVGLEFWRTWPAVMAGLHPAQPVERASDDDSREGGPGTAGGTEAGAAAPAAAPDGGGAGLDELTRRLAALEERIAALEARAPGRGGRAAGKRRKGRS